MKPNGVVIPPGWDKIYERWHYAPAIRDGDHLRCSGAIGVGRDGTISPDAEMQSLPPFAYFRFAMNASMFLASTTIGTPPPVTSASLN
jgi:hypothetical protein